MGGHNQPHSIFKQFIFSIFITGITGVLFISSQFLGSYFLRKGRRNGLGFDKVDDAVQLIIRNKGSLYPERLVGPCRKNSISPRPSSFSAPLASRWYGCRFGRKPQRQSGKEYWP